MRTLHVTDRLSARGGADWHLLGVVKELERQGQVQLVAGRNEAEGAVSSPVTVQAGIETGDTAALAALDDLVGRFAPAVIHLHNCMNPGVLEWGAARGAVLTVQDHRFFCPGRGKLTLDGRPCGEPMAPATCASCFTDHAYFARIEAVTQRRFAAARRMRATIVLSRYMREELVTAGLDGRRIAVVPPFVHGLPGTAVADGPPCILFVGRLVAAKGVFDAVEAHRRAGMTLPLVFAGSGTERPHLEAAGCDVLGWVPHERLASGYRRARAVVMPSRWQEPFGIVGLEALSMGVPVVAWDSGGVREWHPAVTAWGDIDALAHALRAAPGSPARMPPGFDPGTLMARLRGVYARVAGD